MSGDGSAKIFATYGRYFQPVSANMNITQGSASIEWFEYFELDDLDANGAPSLMADGSPSRGDMLRDRRWRQRGITEPGLIASSSLKPMYSDEFTIGYQQEVFVEHHKAPPIYFGGHQASRLRSALSHSQW